MSNCSMFIFYWKFVSSQLKNGMLDVIREFGNQISNGTEIKQAEE